MREGHFLCLFETLIVFIFEGGAETISIDVISFMNEYSFSPKDPKGQATCRFRAPPALPSRSTSTANRNPVGRA